VQQIFKACVLLLIVAITLPGCSSFSQQARVDRAHRKYVHKARREHQKETSKAIKEANRPLRNPPGMSAPMTSVTLDPLPSDNGPAPVATNADAQPTP
jgi:hypothetical protein